MCEKIFVFLRKLVVHSWRWVCRIMWPFSSFCVLRVVDFLDHVYFRWSRSIYRSTIGRYIGRLSTFISVDCRSTIGRLSVDYRSIFDRYSTDISVDSRPTDMSTDIVLVHRYLTDTWPILGRYLADTWPILDRYLTDTWQALDRYFTDNSWIQWMAF